MSEPSPLKTYLEALDRKDVDPVKLGPNPYQSLYYFQGTSTSLLTTRDEASAQIRERFSREQSVVVIGGSGCGKSSLVRGKVLDELRNVLHPIPDRHGDWRAIVFRPVTKPLRQFTDAFWRDVVAPAFAPVNENDYDRDNDQDRRALENEEQRRSLVREFIGQGNDEHAAQKHVEDELIQPAVVGDEHQGFVSARRLADQINLISSGGRRPGPLNLMIIIDQFEEAFGTGIEEDDETLEKLWGMIRHLHRRKPEGVYLVLSMRAEDVHRCSAVPGMVDIVNTSVFLVDWLDRADLRKAIIDPARIVLRDWGVLGDAATPTSGSTFPYASDVVERLLDEVEKLKKTLDHKSDHLPLLQHGLHVLWRKATDRWRKELKAGQGGDFLVTDEDLPPQTNATADLWLQAQLAATAEDCLGWDKPPPPPEKSALQAFDAVAGDLRLAIPGKIAVRAALCGMAWRDENGIFWRRFVNLGKLVKERLLPDAPHRLDEAQATLEKALGDALGVFVAERLLICEKDGEHDTYTVAHEALIRNWPTLRRWVEEEDELVRAYLDAPDNDKGGKRVTYSINPRYKDVLAATCGWLPPKKTNYARTFTPAWLQEVLEERLKKRLTGRPAGPENIQDLIRGVRRSWRRNDLRQWGMFLSMIGLACLLAAWWKQLENNQEITRANQEITRANQEITRANQEIASARRWTEALLLARNGEIDGLSDDKMLSEMILAFERTKGHEGEAAGTFDEKIGPKQFIAYSQLVMEWRRRMGSKLQVIAVSEHPPSKFPDKNCHEIKSKFPIGNLAVKISRRDGIKFSDPRTGRKLPVAIKNNYSETTFSDKGLIQLPPNSDQVCISRDAHVLTISTPEVPYPFTYLLSVISDIEKPDSLVGVVVEPLIGPRGQIPNLSRENGWDPNKPATDRQRAHVKVHDITEPNDSGERRILYTIGSSKYTAFISDGLLSPARIPRKTSQPEDRLEWKAVSTGTCDKIVAKDGQSRFEVEAPYIGHAVLTVRQSNYTTIDVNKNSGKYALYVASLHAPLWNCEPIQLGGFISSPIKHMIPILGRDCFSNESLYLEISDKDDKTRDLVLLKSYDGALSLLNSRFEMYGSAKGTYTSLSNLLKERNNPNNVVRTTACR